MAGGKLLPFALAMAVGNDLEPRAASGINPNIGDGVPPTPVLTPENRARRGAKRAAQRARAVRRKRRGW